jgi:Gp5 C-terminal repeat (3 copies)
LLALASKHGKPEKAVNPDDKAKEPIKLPGFGTAQWAALSKSFAHLAEKGYPEHIKTVLRQGGLDPDNITAMAKAAVAQQQAEQTAKLTIQMYHCNHLGTPIALINTQGMKDGAGDANALRFDDRLGEEQLWIHAQLDQLTEVENDESKWVGRDRVKDVDRDETNTIGRDRTETVMHDETITVHNDRTERVDHNEKISIGDNRTKSVGKNEKDNIGKSWSINVGKYKTETIGMAYMQNVGLGRMENVGLGYNLNVGMVMATVVGMHQSTNVGKDWSQTVGGNWSNNTDKVVQIKAGESIELVCGASVLKMDSGGNITLNGANITIAAKETIAINAGTVLTESAGDSVVVSAPTILLN